ncbi:MAG TPA: phosphopentomutase, partial [Gemmatimonadaceae bacterium]|nr:phosphopentomutase [Gemmatimonadaceae bacterium]
MLDGVGAGAAPDAAAYGDEGSDTLGNLSRAVGGLSLPNLERLGLGRITAVATQRAIREPVGAWGTL